MLGLGISKSFIVISFLSNRVVNNIFSVVAGNIPTSKCLVEPSIISEKDTANL